MPLACIFPLVFFLRLIPACRHWVELLFACVMIAWATFYIELWKHTEAVWRMRWGMEEFALAETTRAEFIGVWTLSEVDRHSIMKVDRYGKLRRLATNLITMAFIGLVLLTVSALYAYERFLIKSGHLSHVTLVNFAIAIQMQVYNLIWKFLSVKLTDFDNHETESGYYEGLVKRVFVFQFINSYSALFYLVLMGHDPTGTKQDYSTKLAMQLRIIFCIYLISHLAGVLMPYLSYLYRLRFDDRDDKRQTTHSKASVQVSRRSGYTPMPQPNKKGTMAARFSFMETQAKLDSYEVKEDVWERIDIMMELGYVLFFGFVAPEIIALLLVSNLIRIRAFGWMLLYALRRPFPRGADGLGKTMNFLYRVMCRAAVLINIVLLTLYNAQSPRSEDVFLWLRSQVTTQAPGVPRQSDWKAIMTVILVVDIVAYLIQKVITSSVKVPEIVALNAKRALVILDELQNLLYNADGNHLVARATASLGKDSKSIHTLEPGGCHWVATDAQEASYGLDVPAWSPLDPWFQEGSLRT